MLKSDFKNYIIDGVKYSDLQSRSEGADGGNVGLSWNWDGFTFYSLKDLNWEDIGKQKREFLKTFKF